MFDLIGLDRHSAKRTVKPCSFLKMFVIELAKIETGSENRHPEVEFNTYSRLE